MQFARRSDDSLFLQAQPVNYPDHVPVQFDEQGFIDWLSGRRSLYDADLLSQYLYTKTADWAPEREWRIVAGTGCQPAAERDMSNSTRPISKPWCSGSGRTRHTVRKITQLVAERYPECQLREMSRAVDRMAYEIVDLSQDGAFQRSRCGHSNIG